MTTELQAAAEEIRLKESDTIERLERLISIHNANYKVFMRRYVNNGERDPEYSRECQRNASYSARAVVGLTKELRKII